MTYKTLADMWDDPNRAWPTTVYVSTSNICNARCLSCVNELVQVPRGVMSLDAFKRLVDKVCERGVAIGAMFCFGEPLTDPTLLDKYAHANARGALAPGHVGLNTNCSLLTPNLYDPILQYTPNIILSFHHVGSDYERLTGLSWDVSYANARGFLDYRAQIKPEYPVAIGVNYVPGSSLTAVQDAFADYDVTYVRDVHIRWKPPILTGVLDRTIMHPWWRCDGYKGAMQVLWNGDCFVCAFDMIGTPQTAETTYANVLTDSWSAIEQKFRAAWRACPPLCYRCDYWHRADALLANDCQRPDPLPSDWYAWQVPFVGLNTRD